MKLLFIIFYINILDKIKGKFETIYLEFDSNNYYIPIKVNQHSNFEYFIFSNILPINFFPSSKCSVCQSYHINEKDNTSYSFIKKNVSVPYYYLTFSGDLYKSNLTLGTQTKSLEFVSFDNINYVQKYNGKGRFSLSFLNYYFNTTKKIFALTLRSQSGELDLGGYNEDKISDESKIQTFNISKTNYNSTNEYKNLWYINFNKLIIKDHEFNKNYKLTLDVSTNSFHIPKDFFFENAHHIFSEDSRCQVQQQGYFLCICDRDYETKFGNFKFVNQNNKIIEIKVTDYILFDDSGTGNSCYVFLEINYESDLFIGGKYIMNKYYTIFDIDNNQLKIYPNSNGSYYFDQRSIILFLFTLSVGGLLLLSCYFIYKRFFSRNPEEDNLNDDLVEGNEEEAEVEGNNGEIDDQQQNIEEENFDNNNMNNNLNNENNNLNNDDNR